MSFHTPDTVVLMSLSSHRSVLAALALTALGALSGCDDGEAGFEPVLALRTDPAAVLTTVGAQVPVVLRLGEAGRDGSVRWLSGRPDLVRLDTVVAAGTPARLQALAAGRSVVTATVRSRGQVATVTVPVEIVPPPAGVRDE